LYFYFAVGEQAGGSPPSPLMRSVKGDKGLLFIKVTKPALGERAGFEGFCLRRLPLGFDFFDLVRIKAIACKCGHGISLVDSRGICDRLHEVPAGSYPAVFVNLLFDSVGYVPAVSLLVSHIRVHAVNYLIVYNRIYSELPFSFFTELPF